jgi:putative ABC transport system substrate-binding protein
MVHLPVQLPTTLNMATEMKTAKSQGFDVPATLLSRADELIE